MHIKSATTFGLIIVCGAVGCGADGSAAAKASGGGGTVQNEKTGGASNTTTGGAPAAGGTKATGGATTVAPTTGGTSSALDCSATMPTSGSQVHNSNSRGGAGNLAWEIWTNNNSGASLTTFGNTPAFSASWNNSGNYLGRLGFEWGNSPQTYDKYGTITAQFVAKKSGSSGGQWSYVGIYGWSTNPCIEWYIIDDSFSNMPINPGSCTNMSNSPLSVDDGQYTMCVRSTTGTGGSRCGSSVGNWNQYYSIRRSNRTCGTISVTKHFDAWKAAGNNLGNLLEVKILVEVGAGQGTVEFPIANVTKTQ